MPVVRVEPYGARVEVESGATLLEALARSGVRVASVCGGRGFCGKCRVLVTGGSSALSPPSRSESMLLGGDLGSGYRLACQARVHGDVAVYVPEESRESPGERVAAVDGYARPVRVAPPLRRVSLSLTPPSLSDWRSDEERLAEGLGRVLGGFEPPGLDVLRSLPRVARESSWSLEVVAWRGRVLSVEPGGSGRGTYAVAVDLGTSKLVAHLVDASRGVVVAKGFAENPQLAYGEDIMTRMDFASRSPGNLDLLRRVLVEGVNGLVARLRSSLGVRADEVYAFAFAGNTAMQHFLLGLDVSQLARAPYVAVTRRALEVRAADLGLEAGPGAVALVFPVIGGFVGGDAVADVLATGLHRRDYPAMLVDVGTNTEVVVGSGDRFLSGSAPSGPAFEGMQITFGMKAVSGAIDRVRVGEDGEVEYTTVGGARPRGICGSAMIDLVAELYRAGLLDARGRFRRDASTRRLRRGERGMEFVVAWAKETSIGRDIVFTEKDVEQVLLAKAAVSSAARTLMKMRGFKAEELEEVVVAGSFGSSLNVENALEIGLLPPVPPEKVWFAGNTAVGGAVLALVSEEALSELDEILSKVEFVEFAASPEWKAEFMNSLFIPYREPPSRLSR
ncbi:ASKHA domain-containing protein [Thermofilum pendens]|uniref:Ferredoxin n=1 Tax=Thermofilum pendens (strain DSM 2475 / Hrk 5) TaxID=368408 RepID=A1S001_THEPD|nr:ASKHA domain-containing protein [Thermofilum pendens]ABL78781.1 ferredoxin [Thermofilum pendens Hrk 5]